MDKRYQVFVSSTFADLKDERQQVMQTLMKMDCIPSGMELFPAADEEQFEFIKKVIDDCDYYVLIVGGRYGSVAADGISYTEKEYQYAIDKGIKVLAFLHEDPSQIASGKTDLAEPLRKKLAAFRSKVGSGRLVNFWKSADQLPGMVALSLLQTIKAYPAVGWIRADQASQIDVLNQLNDVRRENDELKQQVLNLKRTHEPKVLNLAGLDETINIKFDYTAANSSTSHTLELSLTWKDLFGLVSPLLLTNPTEDLLAPRIAEALVRQKKYAIARQSVNDEDLDTIKIHFKALGLINLRHDGSYGRFSDVIWSLTPKGEQTMMETRAVKSTS